MILAVKESVYTFRTSRIVTNALVSFFHAYTVGTAYPGKPVITTLFPGPNGAGISSVPCIYFFDTKEDADILGTKTFY